VRRNTKLWWLKIIGWSLAGLAAGWIVVHFLPENYTSEATLRLEPSTVSKDFLPHESVDVNHLVERLRPTVLSRNVLITLGGHLKTGHTWSLQNRPTKLSQDKSSYTLPRAVGANIFSGKFDSQVYTVST
jgi:hypothetical protein